ncbi:hypothetical protein GOP47_0015669 [Adiantum capillus-veneris]|uniref:Uncharacterized protein n=1 Tax=Adiantum capillus-veneris TaxID=13818 RepID=A0A9D4ZBF3_ADICA|nr:hypothetical protein GOP47_0015669 [Adiantum capillus-veneris]
MDLTLGVSLVGQLRAELKLTKCLGLRHNCRTVVRSLKSGDNEASGDADVQQTLVDIIRLETGKVRVSDYIQDKAKLLSNIADQAMLESDRIATDALKDFDEASAKTIKAIDEGFQAVEEQLASDLAEINSGQEELDEFEKSVQNARSQGLFFKGLYKPLKRWKDRDPAEQEAIREEANQIAETTGALMKSKSRKNLYILLIFLMGFLLVESVTSAERSLSGIIVSIIIISLLSIQLLFEKSISSRKDDTE